MAKFFSITDNNLHNFLKAGLIVVMFAVAHLIVCMLLHDTVIGDGFFLTILTIAMVFCLIKYYKSPFDVFLGMAFLCCFAGYYFGNRWGNYLSAVKPEWGVANNMIVTFFTTIVLGLATILVVGTRFKKNGVKD